MAQRSNHYDAAFEQLLRQSRIPYVCVDETRRALLANASLKSMDFIVYAPDGKNLLVDVKGRRFGAGAAGHRWENWATAEDVRCLRQWEQVFGSGFRAVLVFAYDLVDPRDRRAHPACFEFRGRTYAFYGVWVDEYGDVMRSRSLSWETVWLPAADYRRLRAPIDAFLAPSADSPGSASSLGTGTELPPGNDATARYSPSCFTAQSRRHGGRAESQRIPSSATANDVAPGCRTRQLT